MLHLKNWYHGREIQPKLLMGWFLCEIYLWGISHFYANVGWHVKSMQSFALISSMLSDCCTFSTLQPTNWNLFMSAWFFTQICYFWWSLNLNGLNKTSWGTMRFFENLVWRLCSDEARNRSQSEAVTGVIQ